MQGSKKAVAALGVVAALVFGSAQPAHAASAEVVAVLTGTMSADPLLNMPASIQLNLFGPAVGLVGTVPSSCSANFSVTGFGNPPPLEYQGSGSASCIGVGVNVNCSVVFRWTALTLLQAWGSCSGSASGPIAITWLTQYVPTSRLVTAQGTMVIGVVN